MSDERTTVVVLRYIEELAPGFAYRAGRLALAGPGRAPAALNCGPLYCTGAIRA
jgi:hypothetical protein